MSKRKRFSIADHIEKIDEENRNLEDQMTVGGRKPPMDTLANSKNYHEIIRLLHEEPALVEPTLRWVQSKVIELASAKLNVLFTPEEILALRERHKKELETK